MTRTDLVGREPELAALATWLAEAGQGRPRVVLCDGEPGIGKTRLAEEAVATAAAVGALTAWGVGVDAAGAPPYWPWRQVLTMLAAAVDLVALAGPHARAPELGLLVPGLVPGGDPGIRAAASVEDRFRQFEAVVRLLRQVSLHLPLVIVLDDAHWADEPSLLLLQHVARAVTDERLLVLVNARDTGPHPGPLLSGLLREPAARHLHLAGLPAPAIRRQLAQVLGHDPDDADVGEVAAATRGNPFFVAEMGRVLAERRPGGQPRAVTPTVRDAITARLDGLSPRCVGALRAAAVLGAQFSPAIVAAMTGVPVVECLAALDEAQAAGLTEPGDGLQHLRFVHALVRDAIEAGLGTAEQVRLHREAAAAIEAAHPSPRGPLLFDLARHWAAAAVGGDGARAAAWLERAGVVAMDQRAYEESARLLRQALAVGGGALDAETRCRLLLGVAAAANLATDLGACLDACLDAAALAREMERPDLLAEAALRMDPNGQPGFAIAIRRLCEEADARLPPDAAALRSRVLARFAETFVFLPGAEAAGPASATALALAEASGDGAALAAALGARRVVCAGPDGLEERERLSARLLALAQAGADPALEMAARLWQIDASLERGDLGRVGAEIEAASSCAEEVRGPLARFQVLSCRAVLAQAQGRYPDAARWEAEAFRVLLPTRYPAAFHLRAAVSSLIARHVGPGPAAVAGASFEQAPPEVRDASGLIAGVNRALALVTAGATAEGAQAYRGLGPVTAWRPPPHVVLFSSAIGVAVAAALGERDDVAVLRERLAPYRGHHVVSGTTAVGYFGPVELWLGVAARQLGRMDDAVADLEQAEQACGTSGAAGFEVEVRYELATALAQRAGRGDQARARAVLAQARRTATALGMGPLVDRIDRLAGRLESEAGTGSLTRREREVAQLVALGLTNREIAARLFVSERTAENHVQHILTKLGLANRSQLAAWVSGGTMSIAPE